MSAVARDVLTAEVMTAPDFLPHTFGRHQPDASFATPGCYGMIEAKRIQRSSFRPQQLAHEYLAVTAYRCCC